MHFCALFHRSPRHLLQVLLPYLTNVPITKNCRNQCLQQKYGLGAFRPRSIPGVTNRTRPPYSRPYSRTRGSFTLGQTEQTAPMHPQLRNDRMLRQLRQCFRMWYPWSRYSLISVSGALQTTVSRLLFRLRYFTFLITKLLTYSCDNKPLDILLEFSIRLLLYFHFPRSSQDRPCKANETKGRVKVKSYTVINNGSEIALKELVGTKGPVSVGITADNGFQFYR